MSRCTVVFLSQPVNHVSVFDSQGFSSLFWVLLQAKVIGEMKIIEEMKIAIAISKFADGLLAVPLRNRM